MQSDISDRLKPSCTPAACQYEYAWHLSKQGICKICLQVVLAPVAAGAWLNMSFPKVMKRLSPFAPLLAASMTILISASIVGQNAAAIRAAGPQLVLAVVCLHLGAPCRLHLHMSGVAQSDCWKRGCLNQPGLVLPGLSIVGQDDSRGNKEAPWSAAVCIPPVMCHLHHLMRRRLHAGVHSVTTGRPAGAASQDKLH